METIKMSGSSRLKRPDVVAIIGFPRCGSSLLMQMLSAGGFPVDGEHPDFESYLPTNDVEWIKYQDMAGRAVKLLDHFLDSPPPEDIPQRFIRLRRDHDEQARSFVKFSELTMPGVINTGQRSRVKYAQSFKDDTAKLDLLASAIGPVLQLRFADMLIDPRSVAEQVSEFIEFDLDIDAAVRQVIQRDPDCQPDMSIEMELVARGPM